MSKTELKTRLKNAIKNNGMNAAELSRLSGLKPSFIYDILNGKSTNPSTAKIAKISSILNVELSYLLGIEDIPTKPSSDKSEFVMVSSILTTTNNDDKNSTPKILDEHEGEPYYFRSSWVHDRLNTKAENLRMVFVQGDSMEPTLCQGDMVLVDVTKKNPSPPGIFVIFDGMGLVVKRLEFIPNSNPASVRVLSDSPQYHPYERQIEETEIIGRVVWFAREI